MSVLWPHPPYAEDQPYSTTILATHVLFRGFQIGAVTGPLFGTVRYAVLRRRQTATTSNVVRASPAFFPTIIHSTGTGAIIGTGILALALVGRMQGKEDIEWQDRAWRLLENKGQVEVDTWSLVGSGAGAAAVLGSGMRGFRPVVGGLGIGGTVGVLGYMGWRHGIKGGKWPDDE